MTIVALMSTRVERAPRRTAMVEGAGTVAGRVVGRDGGGWVEGGGGFWGAGEEATDEAAADDIGWSELSEMEAGQTRRDGQTAGGVTEGF